MDKPLHHLHLYLLPLLTLLSISNSPIPILLTPSSSHPPSINSPFHPSNERHGREKRRSRRPTLERSRQTPEEDPKVGGAKPGGIYILGQVERSRGGRTPLEPCHVLTGAILGGQTRHRSRRRRRRTNPVPCFAGFHQDFWRLFRPTLAFPGLSKTTHLKPGVSSSCPSLAPSPFVPSFAGKQPRKSRPEKIATSRHQLQSRRPANSGDLRPHFHVRKTLLTTGHKPKQGLTGVLLANRQKNPEKVPAIPLSPRTFLAKQQASGDPKGHRSTTTCHPLPSPVDLGCRREQPPPPLLSPEPSSPPVAPPVHTGRTGQFRPDCVRLPLPGPVILPKPRCPASLTESTSLDQV